MTIVFFVVVSLLVAFLVVDYFRELRQDRTRERLLAGVYDTDEAEVSLWGDTDDLLRLEATQRMLAESWLARRFDLKLRQSGLRLTLSRAILMMVVITAMGAAASYLLTGFLVAAVAAALLIPLIFWSVVAKLASYRLRKLERQLPSIVAQMISTLRSGGTPIQALHSVSRNSPTPARESVAEVLHAIQIGIPAAQAWREWSQFWDTRSSKLLAVGISIKWETGGQMSAILAHILDTMEFQRRIELRIGTVTAQARFSAYILTLLPFLIGWMIYMIRPDPIEDFFRDPFGQKALMSTAGLLLIGFLWLQKMAKLDY